MQGTWNLRRRLALSGGEIAYDVLGYGPPLILVHGTPSRSYIWRDVALRLADRFFATYLEGWRGESGQRLYLLKDAQLDEEDTAEFEPLLSSIGIPLSIIWGEQDAWLDPALAERLHELIPGSDLLVLPQTGHFAMEDSPQEVATALFEFFTDCEIRPR